MKDRNIMGKEKYENLTEEKIRKYLEDLFIPEGKQIKAWVITPAGIIPIEQSKEFDEAMKAEVAKWKSEPMPIIEKKEPYDWTQQIPMEDRRFYKQLTYEDIVRNLEEPEEILIRKHDRWFNIEHQTECVVISVGEEGGWITIAGIVDSPGDWPYNFQHVEYSIKDFRKLFVKK